MSLSDLQHIDPLEPASSRLSRLTVTQKFLGGVLVAVLVAGGVWYSRIPAKSIMEPVLDQALDAGQLAQVSAHLTQKQIAFRIDGGKVFVASDKKLQALADLLYEDLLPTNTETGFDTMIKQASIWDSSTKLDQMYLVAKQHTLNSVIGRFPGVKKATVVIDPSNQQYIGGSITATAMADIQTWGDAAVKNRRQLALAVVNAVTGAQSNLSREKVQVTIDGAPCRPSDEREAYASIELAENLQRREQSCVAKVRQQLAFIPDALITVTVGVPEAEANVNIGRAATQASATIVANTARRLTAAAPVSRREVDAASVVSASIAVPRSYFVKIYQRSNPKLSEPSDGILQPIIDSELDKIRKLVRSCLSIKNEDDVTVESYYDFMPLAVVPATETASSLPLLAFVMGSRNAQIALGVMGLFTFVALPLMLVLRRRPQPSMVSSRPIHAALLAPRRLEDFENDQEFDDSDDPEEGDQHRLGLEDLAAEDPNAAAEVVQRWMSEK